MLRETRKTMMRLLVVVLAFVFISVLGLSFVSCSKGISEQDEQGAQGGQESLYDPGDGSDPGTGEVLDDPGDGVEEGSDESSEDEAVPGGDRDEDGSDGGFVGDGDDYASDEEHDEDGPDDEDGDAGLHDYAVGGVVLYGDGAYLTIISDDEDGTAIGAMEVSSLLGDISVDEGETVVGICLDAYAGDDGRTMYAMTAAIMGDGIVSDAYELDITNLVEGMARAVELGSGSACPFSLSDGVVAGTASRTQADGEITIAVTYWYGETFESVIPAPVQIGICIEDVRINGNDVEVKYSNKDGYESLFDLAAGLSSETSLGVDVVDGNIVFYTGDDPCDESSWITAVDVSVFEADFGEGDGKDGGRTDGVLYMVDSAMYSSACEDGEPGERITRYYLVITYSDGSTEIIYMYYTGGDAMHSPAADAACVDHQWSGTADTMMVSGEVSCLEGYWMAESCSLCGAVRTDDMSNWVWVSRGEHAWMWSDETYYEVVRKTEADGDTSYLFLPEGGVYVISGYCSVCGTDVTVKFTLDDAVGYSGGDPAWLKANGGLAGLFDEYGFEFGFDYPAADDSWDCSTGVADTFTLTISDGTRYEFDYWYSEYGTHVSANVGGFLDEEDFCFTEVSVSLLNLYYEIDDAGKNVAYVYFFDETYGTVYIYGAEEGDDRLDYYDGWTGELLGTNVRYDLSGTFFFYDSSYDAGRSGSDRRFEAMKDATCEDGQVAVGYFFCSCCGTKAEIYASRAHSFASTGGKGVTLDRPSSERQRDGCAWSDATCSGAASHVSGCLECGEDILIYGLGKTGHEYACRVEADEDENLISIYAECLREGCGAALEAAYTLYVEYDAGNPLYGPDDARYHRSANPLTGRVYFELCSDAGCGEAHYVINAEDGLNVCLNIERHAECDVSYDAATGEWTVSGDEAGEPSCSEGAYNVYTLSGSYLDDLVGGMSAFDVNETGTATCCWYVERTGNEIKLMYPYDGSYTYTVYAAQAFGVNGSSYPDYGYANYVHADGSDFKVYARAEKLPDGGTCAVEAYFYAPDGTKLYMDTGSVYEIQLDDVSCSSGSETWMTVHCSCGKCGGVAESGRMSMIVNVAEAYVPHSFGSETAFLLSDGTFDYETYIKAVEEQEKYESSRGEYVSAWPEGVPSVDEWLAFTIDREPSCGQTGSAYTVCSACGEAFYFEIRTCEHEYEKTYDPEKGKIVLVCGNVEECGADVIEVKAQFVRFEEATCASPAKAVFVGYLEDANVFFEVEYVVSSGYASHSINGVSIECAYADRAFDETCDTVYYLETYEAGGAGYSRVYTVGDDGEYVILYDTGDESDPLYGMTDGIITVSDTSGANCAPVTESNPARVSGTFVCSVCGRTCYIWLKTMHAEPDGDARTTDNYRAVENTCTECGYVEYRCLDCGELVRVYNDGYAAVVTGHVFAETCDMIVVGSDGTYATAYYSCVNCGFIAEETLMLSDAVYVGRAEAYSDDLDNQYWGTVSDCTTAGELHYSFKVLIWTGICDGDGEPVYQEAVVSFTVHSSASGHSWSGMSYLGVAYDSGTFYYMESYECAVCGQLVVESCPIYVYDEDTAYCGSGLGKEGDTTQPYAYYVELADQIAAGGAAYVFSINYDSFSKYEGEENGTVYYLGYKFTYSYTSDKKTYGPYTVMFVVMAGDSESDMEDLVKHKSMHQEHEGDTEWGALEKDSDGKVLLFLWVEDDGTARYYGMCKYDGAFVTLFVLDERDDDCLEENMDCYIVNKATA